MLCRKVPFQRLAHQEIVHKLGNLFTFASK
jgi:hypothetical protein